MSALEEAAAAIPVRPDLPALAAGLVTVAAWGSAFVGIRAAGEALSPGPIALGRLLVCCAALGTAALVRREPLPARRDLLQIAVYGVLWLGIYSVALNAAERRVDAGTAAMLVNIGPILIAIMAGTFLGEGFPRGLFAAPRSPSPAARRSASRRPGRRRGRTSASSCASSPPLPTPRRWSSRSPCSRASRPSR